MRSEILKLRNDPTANAVMAGAFTQANAALLSQKLGRSPSEGELYIAHFLGAGGAARLISLAAGNPHASAASYFPIAAHANSSIFYDRTTGAPRSLAQVRDILTARYDVAARGPSAPVSDGASAAPATAPSPVTAPRPPAAPTIGFHGSCRSFHCDHSRLSRGCWLPMPPPSPPQPLLRPTAAAVPDTAGMTSAFAAAVPQRARAGQRRLPRPVSGSRPHRHRSPRW